MTIAPLRYGSTSFLHIQDGLLTQEDEELPFARHIVGTLQYLYFVEDFEVIVFMWAKEVIVSNPEGKVIVGTVDVIETVCVTVRSLIGAVQSLNHLFERAVFRRNSIVVGKSNYLSDFEGKVFSKLLYEFHCSEWVSTVSICNELKILRQFYDPLECHTHGQDAGADTTIIRDLVADDGSCSGIHDEPDIGLDTPDFYIGLIRSEYTPLFVGVQIDKGFDTDGSGFAVVSDLLVGNADVIQVF